MKSSTIQIDENQITTKCFFNEKELTEIWEPKPSYSVGSQYFDFEGERYFLIKKIERD